MRRAFTLVEVVLSAALLSLLLVVLAGSFASLRKSALARARKLESRLPVVQSTERLSMDLRSSGTDGIVVNSDLISICPKESVNTGGRCTWSQGLQIWAWRASRRELAVYRLDPPAAAAAGFVGTGTDPLCPPLTELQAYVAKDDPAPESYRLEDCRFALSDGDLVEILVTGIGSPPFQLARTVGFHL